MPACFVCNIKPKKRVAYAAPEASACCSKPLMFTQLANHATTLVTTPASQVTESAVTSVHHPASGHRTPTVVATARCYYLRTVFGYSYGSRYIRVRVLVAI
eukprot:scaffold392565_cov20-Prasinocladus_malaysianus.AAC.1